MPSGSINYNRCFVCNKNIVAGLFRTGLGAIYPACNKHLTQLKQACETFKLEKTKWVSLTKEETTFLKLLDGIKIVDYIEELMSKR